MYSDHFLATAHCIKLLLLWESSLSLLAVLLLLIVLLFGILRVFLLPKWHCIFHVFFFLWSCFYFWLVLSWLGIIFSCTLQENTVNLIFSWSNSSYLVHLLGKLAVKVLSKYLYLNQMHFFSRCFCFVFIIAVFSLDPSQIYIGTGTWLADVIEEIWLRVWGPTFSCCRLFRHHFARGEVAEMFSRVLSTWSYCSTPHPQIQQLLLITVFAPVYVCDITWHQWVRSRNEFHLLHLFLQYTDRKCS